MKKRLLKGKKKLFLFLYRHFFMKLPLKSKVIVFESFRGKYYSDNPKNIYEYLKANHYDYTYVWIVKNRRVEIPGKPERVKRFSLRYYYYLARAKYRVMNSRLSRNLQKPNGVVYLQTWHGTPLKKLALDMDEVHIPGITAEAYKRNFVKETKKWDYLISPNYYSTKIFRRAFDFQGKIIESGYPRNDILYNWNETDVVRIRQKLKIPSGKKVILYAPTWRDNEYYVKGQYKFELQLDLERMKTRLGDEYVILLRMHYFIANQFDVAPYSDFAFDVSDYDDIAEIYIISDILITDYSSVFFDFANLKRPMLFFMYDLESYRDKLRGFYINIEKELPGPILESEGEVISAIENIDQFSTQYKPRLDAFYTRFCSFEDGYASERVVNEVFGQ